MQQRMKNPALIIPEANSGIQTLIKATHTGGVPPATLELVHLRASQINSCSFCVDSGSRSMRKYGESEDRIASVAAWQETDYFTDAERAALALTEAVTRMADRSEPVPDALWEEVCRYYDERGRAALVLWIATSNLFNHINRTVRQPAGKVEW